MRMLSEPRKFIQLFEKRNLASESPYIGKENER